MMPPNVTDLKADQDAAFDRDRRDAADLRALRQGQVVGGLVLVHADVLDELNNALADILATTRRVKAQRVRETAP